MILMQMYNNYLKQYHKSATIVCSTFVAINKSNQNNKYNF